MKAYFDMAELVARSQISPDAPFTRELILSICFEESLFENVRQKGGGTGMGFGQVEPAELPKLTTEDAKKLGYYVEGVTAQTREVSDEKSIEITSAMLMHLYHASKSTTVEGKIDFALKGYAGYWSNAPSPISKEDRLNIIKGWRACEEGLRLLPRSRSEAGSGKVPLTEVEDGYMAALRLSRQFNPTVERPKLFPPGWPSSSTDSPSGGVARAVGTIVAGVAAGVAGYYAAARGGFLPWPK